MLLRGAYGLSPRSFIGRHLLQLTALPWTTEASTRERWQFGAITNRKATSSNRTPSLTSLYDYSLYRDKLITIIRLWWLSQWLVTYGHHLVVTIYWHVAPSSGRHTALDWIQFIRIRFGLGLKIFIVRLSLLPNGYVFPSPSPGLPTCLHQKKPDLVSNKPEKAR